MESLPHVRLPLSLGLEGQYAGSRCETGEERNEKTKGEKQKCKTGHSTKIKKENSEETKRRQSEIRTHPLREVDQADDLFKIFFVGFVELIQEFTVNIQYRCNFTIPDDGHHDLGP